MGINNFHIIKTQRRNDMNNFKIISYNSVKQVVRDSKNTSSQHPGLGDAEYISVFEDKIYRDKTIADVFQNNNIENVDSIIDLIEDGDTLKQAGGRKYNSGNAKSLLMKGKNLEEYIKVIIYFPPNLTPQEQIKYRDICANAIHNNKMPPFSVNKVNTTNLVQRNYQGLTPVVKGQIHNNQSNEPHCEISFQNRSWKNIQRNSEGKIISAEVSPIIDLSNSDILSNFVGYIEDELEKNGFKQKLNLSHVQIKTMLTSPQSVSTATENLLNSIGKQVKDPANEAPAMPELPEVPEIGSDDEPSAKPEQEHKEEAEQVTTPSTEEVITKKPDLQETLNEKIKQELIEEGIDKESLERTFDTVSSIDTSLNIQSETGGFKDPNHVNITLEKAKNSTHYEINQLFKQIEAKKKEYEIIQITQDILERNKILEENNSKLIVGIKQQNELNVSLNKKVEETVSKNLELSIDLDTAKESNDHLLAQRINREKEFDKKLSSKERLLKAYKEKITSGFSRLNSENNALLKSNNSLKTENESFLSEVASYADQNEKLSKEMKALKEASEKEIKSLKEKNESLTNEVKEIKEIKNELKEASQLNRDSLLKINVLLQTIADKDANFNEKLKTQVDAVKAQEAQKLDSFKKANKKQNDQIAEQIKSLQSNYKAELTEKDEIIQKLKEELEQFKNPKPKTPKA